MLHRPEGQCLQEVFLMVSQEVLAAASVFRGIIHRARRQES